METGKLKVGDWVRIHDGGAFGVEVGQIVRITHECTLKVPKVPFDIHRPKSDLTKLPDEEVMLWKLSN